MSIRRKKVIVSLDMTEMDHILWMDVENLTILEAGIIGQDLEMKVHIHVEFEHSTSIHTGY